MKTITVTGFAHCRPASNWQAGDSNVIDGFQFGYCHIKLEGDGYIPAGTATLTIEVPDDFDPRMGVVDALKDQKQKLMAEFQSRINEIDKQISQYTAIEYAEEA
jgi:hypothetical protein